MTSHPFLTRLDASLDGIVAPADVELRGEWTTSLRRTYESGAAAASAGPFREVVDARWRGSLTSSDAIVGIAFLVRAGGLDWVKGPDAKPTLPVEVSLSAYVDYMSDRATFTANLAGGYLPGVPVRGGEDVTTACIIEPGLVTMGQVTCVAHADVASFHVLLLPRAFVKVGRSRLWRLRDEIAATLPADIGKVLARHRTGIEA